MRNRRILPLLLAGMLCLPAQPAEALSAVHHLYLFARRTLQAIVHPVYAATVEGPRAVKDAYHAEVWEAEKPENRGLFRKKLYGVWRAPGEETKAIIDGLVTSVAKAGDGLKQLVSIFWGD